MMSNKTLIEFNSASMCYFSSSSSARDVVLTDVTFSVDKGELVYMIGKIGSGKSTLLKSIYGDVMLTDGVCRVVGYDMRRIKRRDIPHLRRKLGIVFQDYQLLRDRTVYENLRFVLKATGWNNTSEINKRIEMVLGMVDLSHKTYKMPHHLSGGEQQRLTIGRAILNSPSVIIADEPTGNLDPHSTKEVMDLFMEIRNMGCAIIIATHDVSIIEQYPSRTLRFDRGSVSPIDIFSILGIENNSKTE